MLDPFYPFDWLSSRMVEGLGLSLVSPLGLSLHFFFYDVPKVLTLLAVISLVVGFLQSFLSPEQVRRFLEKQQTIAGNVLAGLLGAVTPFCSCSAVPLFLGFLSAGVPLGVTFSYLIAAPMVDAVAVFLLASLFGLPATVLYVAFGVGLATLVGFAIGQLHLEHWVEPLVRSGAAIAEAEPERLTWGDRLRLAWYQSVEILKSVWVYVVVGIAIGAGIHGYVPTDLVTQWAGRGNALAVVVAVLLGVPLYTNIAGVLPIAEALVNKGMPLGTVLAFAMAVTALSLPQMVILQRVLRPPLLALFVGVTTLGIIAVGYLFNAVLG